MFAFLCTLHTVKVVMCRMFAVAAELPCSIHEVLYASPRSLRLLAREHADGWGIAHRASHGWTIERETASAASSDRYATLSARPARLAIVHVRKATVGGLALANTHPFSRDGLVLAHNGTITG